MAGHRSCPLAVHNDVCHEGKGGTLYIIGSLFRPHFLNLFLHPLSSKCYGAWKVDLEKDWKLPKIYLTIGQVTIVQLTISLNPAGPVVACRDSWCLLFRGCCQSQPYAGHTWNCSQSRLRSQPSFGEQNSGHIRQLTHRHTILGFI